MDIDLTRIIPQFSPGDRVWLNAVPFDVPVCACKRVYGCEGLYMGKGMDVIIQEWKLCLPLCKACHRVMNVGPPDWYCVINSAGKWYIAPYTWLTPIPEDGDEK
ncbi:hypothetical protein LCGC14_0637490 [marine sediment metagenome]|uniref:Uncharacterized protein n=1 Tax=marine sediment metagenome TaxID=412755 RepID=A0A0F9U8I4_9ZZZZ